MSDIKFVSYDGKYPTLCKGTLTISIDGDEISEFNCLISGGYIRSYREEDIVKGKWSINWDKAFNFMFFSDEEKKLITDLVNANVPFGCCGGCI